MDERDFTRRLGRATLGIDGNRWRLAALAAECKQDGYPHWAEKIAAHPRVLRSPSTVYGWAAVMEFHNALPVHPSLPFSHYALALRHAARVDIEDIIEAMQVAAEYGHTLEAMGALLRDLAGPAEPAAPEPPACARCAELTAAVDAMRYIDDAGTAWYRMNGRTLQRMPEDVAATVARLLAGGERAA